MAVERISRLRIFCLLALAMGFSFVNKTAFAEELILCGADEVFIIDANPKSSSTNRLWSWRAKNCPNLPEALKDKFKSTDECKPVDGGKRILITSSGGGVALVERASGKALFWAFVGNAHSAEILPRNRLVVAASTHAEGNRLAVFDIATPEKPILSEPLHSGHGVVWDEKRQLLWALGFNDLNAYHLVDWESDTPKLRIASSHKLPDESGHDLQAVPDSNDLLVTAHSHVYLFNRYKNDFELHPTLGNHADVKCVSVHPTTGATVVVQAQPPNWWTSKLQWLEPKGDFTLTGERLYKARWNPL